MNIANCKLQIVKFLKPFFLNFHFAIFILQFTILIVGCASLKVPRTLMPIPAASPEYAVSDQTITFSNKDMKISILPLKPSDVKNILAEKDTNNPLAEKLSSSQHLSFLMDIENLSKEKVMYNPALTTLFDDTMGVRKPLDYTDIYSLVENLPNPESALGKMKGKFYDLTTTLEPGQKTSRLLLFSGIDEDAKIVTITMKEIYIGTSAIAVSFGFKAKE